MFYEKTEYVMFFIYSMVYLNKKHNIQPMGYIKLKP